MPLENFGSILGFAEEMEAQNRDFFTRASQNPAGDLYHNVFVNLAKGAGKRISETRRVRRENVTEMVLEAVEGLYRDEYVREVGDGSTMELQSMFATSLELMDRSCAFYEAAAGRLKGQADVARSLKTLAKRVKKERRLLSEAAR